MKKVVALSSFERSVKRLTPNEMKRLGRALESLNSFLLGQTASHGFAFKKIGHAKDEFRVDLKHRVIMKVHENVYYLALVGSHDDIKRYLKKEL